MEPLKVLLVLAAGVVALAVCFAVHFYYHYFRLKRCLGKLPVVEHWPVIGSTHLFPDTCAFYDNLANYSSKYGKLYWAMLGPIRALFITDPDLLELILSSPKHVDKAGTYKIFEKLAGNGLIAGNGDVWRRHRKLLTPTFHFRILEKFVAVFNCHVNELIASLGAEADAESTDVKPYCSRLTLGQIMETAMGLRGAENRQDAGKYLALVRTLLRIVMERLIRPWEYVEWTYRLTRNYYLEARTVARLDDYVYSIIRRKSEEYSGAGGAWKAENEDGTKERIVSLDLLVESRSRENLTDVDLKDQVQTIIIAGFETTSSTLSFLIYDLARHPDIQQKVRDEVIDVIESDDPSTSVTTAHLTQMKYLETVIKETMRLYPSAPLIARDLGEDLEWDGMVLPKGLTVVPVICALHRDPKYYPDPERFDPGRFTAEATTGRHPYAYIPFSAGPRNCLGQKYAMLSMKTAISKLLLAYEFVDVGHKIRLAAETSMTSKNGVRVGVRNRSRANKS